MEFTRLGRTGLQVSRICLGTMTYGSKSWRPWILEEEEARPFLKRALEMGINFFDTADMYSAGRSEEIVGKALRDMARREDVVLATKVFFPTGPGPNEKGLSRKHVRAAIDASLKRLGTDHVDLYQIHRWDPHTPVEEVVRALDDVVRAGKALYVGASSMPAWLLAKALYTSERMGCARFVSMQDHYNLLYREEEREMLPLCREEGLGVVPWSPLARGLLAGSRKRGEEGATLRARTDDYAQQLYVQESDWDVVERCAEVAAGRGVPPAQVALAWLLAKPEVTAPIVGASKPQHLEDAVAALSLKLSDEEMKSLEEPYRPHPVLGFR